MLTRGVCEGDIFIFKDFKSIFYLKNIKLIIFFDDFYMLIFKKNITLKITLHHGTKHI